MRVCPSQELVERYVKGECSADERQAVENHLTECEGCQQQVEDTRSNMLDSRGFGPAPADQDVTRSITEDPRIDQNKMPTRSISKDATLPYSADAVSASYESMIEGGTRF